MATKTNTKIPKMLIIKRDKKPKIDKLNIATTVYVKL